VRVLGVKGQEARVRVSWLCEEFRECPSDADEATMTVYTRAWVWHLFAASWMYILALSYWYKAGSYSWGSAVLVY
jgi:hypothetical protein